jgi:hypothetical protein
MVKISRPTISLLVQAHKLQSYFPNSKWRLENCGNTLVWKEALKPSELSLTYMIKLVYQREKHPDVFIVEPKPLLLAKGATKLEHVYCTKKQHICIYYKNASEWNANMMIADSIIPWTSEWLLHYEYWVSTGIWHGGGIH